MTRVHDAQARVLAQQFTLLERARVADELKKIADANAKHVESENRRIRAEWKSLEEQKRKAEKAAAAAEEADDPVGNLDDGVATAADSPAAPAKKRRLLEVASSERLLNAIVEVPDDIRDRYMKDSLRGRRQQHIRALHALQKTGLKLDQAVANARFKTLLPPDEMGMLRNQALITAVAELPDKYGEPLRKRREKLLGPDWERVLSSKKKGPVVEPPAAELQAPSVGSALTDGL